MFSLEIESDKLKEALEAAEVLVDECKLNFTPEGFTIRAVDPANVAMVTLELQREAFINYEASEGEIGVDLKKLLDLLAMSRKDDVVNLQLDETGHKLLIHIGDLSYTTSLLDPSTVRKEPKIPKLELPSQIILPGSVLVRAIKAADKVGSYLWMKVDNNLAAFILEAEGDTDHVQLTLSKDELITLQSETDARSLFSIEYLLDIGKTLGKANEVRINLANDHPVKIQFTIADGCGEVSYLIAPRVESD
ncbi:MAG: proliferating cell nuclear antigen [Candidatus Argoarchaeum ethanivorans]|uniref:DNA polymerase sliding clamp n=1 Tax=Candidatus Argoarchaeum ethanivorans TaxID=2608793 RepID=A0A8B3S2U2_9EURY|nr:MAG: proliferating cell nuclear antigen [Candidatus Argoarchaeum ethanivorans]